MRISVIGLGYLGLVHAALLARAGFAVTGVEHDERWAAQIRSGRAPIFEPGLGELLAEVGGTARLTVTTDASAVRSCHVHFVCVGTPYKVPEGVDTSQVTAAVDDIAPHLDAGSLVVCRSTTPVGTSSALLDRLRTVRPDARVVYNPEFLREGTALQDADSPCRIVCGVEDESDRRDIALLDQVYAGQLSRGVPRLVMNYATAELTKTAANAFLATKISFINALAELCDVAGADVTQLAHAIGEDERIGRDFLSAGVGFGGGCLPKDVRGLITRADELGAGEPMELLRQVEAINRRQRGRLVDLARRACGGALAGKRIAVLGTAFKPDSDDIRESPALKIADRLAFEGAVPRLHDPKALPPARLAFPDLTYCEEVVDAARDADVVLHLTEWREYAKLEPAELIDIVRMPVIIDGRNGLDADRWIAAGWTFRALGRA